MISGPFPVHALRVGQGRSLFEFLPEVALDAELGEQPPDLLVLPASKLTSLDRTFRGAAKLPPRAWAKARQGLGLVVFDATAEGAPAQQDLVENLHRFLNSMGISPARGVYITQDRQFGADYRETCARVGAGAAMTVLYDDYWIRAFLAAFEFAGPATFEARRAAYLARPRERTRPFLSLNLTPRPSKLLFLASVLRDGLWDQGFISLGGFNRHLDKGKAVDGLRSELEGALQPYVDQLLEIGEVLLGGGVGSRTASGLPKFTDDAPLPEYASSWFSVVTETEMRNRPSRITEKPFKPLANFHPLLILGNPGALAFLRSLGFESYGPMFDERYDEEPDPRLRFEMVYTQVMKLCACEESEIERLERAVAETVMSNAEHLFTRLPHLYRSQRNLELLGRLQAISAGDLSENVSGGRPVDGKVCPS